MTPVEEESTEQPWWVNPLYKFGIPSAIALFSVWFLATQVRDKLEAVDNKLNAHIGASIQNQNQNERMLKLLQQICINSAASNQERSQCF